MRINQVEIMELFVDAILNNKETLVEKDDCVDDPDTFLKAIDNPLKSQIVSLNDLLPDQKPFSSLAEYWKKSDPKLNRELLMKIADYLNENKDLFNKPEMKIRKFLDYVYTVV